MPDVDIRLDDLRRAAQQFDAAASKIEDSLGTFEETVNGLTLVGFSSPAGDAFIARYQAQRGLMEAWSGQLRLFSQRLREALTEFERAAAGSGLPSPNAPGTPDGLALPPMPRRRLTGFSTDPLTPPDLPQAPLRAHPIGAYLSSANQPLYGALTAARGELTVAQADVAALTQARDALAADYNALAARLSASGTADPAGHPRLLALQTQLDAYDARLSAAQDTVTRLDAQIGDLTARIARVSPAPGADLALVAALEGGQSGPAVLQNTFDCVRYVAGRMPVPAAIARDAYLWDDMALLHPEYGIQIGHTPLAGSVIVLEPQHAYADDTFGHVLYVERVDGADVWVTDNLHADAVRLGDLSGDWSDVKYLYFPWHTQG